MRSEETFVGQPIRGLQTMLRVLARWDERYPALIPDGIYGKETAEAVTNFQKLHGLQPTGIADQETWNAIAQAYVPANTEVTGAAAVEVILNPSQVIEKQEYHPSVLLAQAILILLADVYSLFDPPGVTGILDTPTSMALESVQMMGDLPITGQLDKATWKLLALQYPVASNRRMSQEKTRDNP